jgi:hypothetical protein
MLNSMFLDIFLVILFDTFLGARRVQRGGSNLYLISTNRKRSSHSTHGVLCFALHDEMILNGIKLWLKCLLSALDVCVMVEVLLD